MENHKISEVSYLLSQGKAHEAIDLLEEELLKYPDNWDIFYHLGFAWRIIGDFDKAISNYNKAIHLCPEGETANHMNYQGLGIVYQLKGEYDVAIDYLERAYKLDKSSVQSLNSLGLTYKKIGNIAKALELYELAAQTKMENIFEDLKKSGHNPFKNETSSENKRITFVNNDYINLVPVKLKDDMTYCILQNNIGTCYALLGKMEDAKNAFLESIEFIPVGMKYEEPYIGLRQLDE